MTCCEDCLTIGNISDSTVWRKTRNISYTIYKTVPVWTKDLHLFGVKSTKNKNKKAQKWIGDAREWNWTRRWSCTSRCTASASSSPGWSRCRCWFTWRRSPSVSCSSLPTSNTEAPPVSCCWFVAAHFSCTLSTPIWMKISISFVIYWFHFYTVPWYAVVFLLLNMIIHCWSTRASDFKSKRLIFVIKSFLLVSVTLQYHHIKSGYS